ncbi:MAG: hypothetical protein MUC84_06380 [Solirubrobacteraceae bacterium]|jgi:hypothetical protein|nr:hypothetical protein [Solirubrobacteraceae bacterium]
MTRATLLLTLALCAAVLAAGCGGGDDTKVVTSTNAAGQATTRTVPDVKFAKTKFVLHTGLALGAFRRWIYRPWKAGTFQQGADGRTAALVKAAAAAAFTANELRLARRAALSDDALRGVGDRLGTLTDKAQGLVPGFRDGKLSPGEIAALAAGLGSVTALARQLGVNVPERSVPSLPGG